MKITNLHIWHCDLTSHQAYYMADGKTCDVVTSVILRLDTDAGLSGWGEVCPIPHYLPAYADGIAPGIAHLAPVLIGQDASHPEVVMAHINAYLIGHPYIKSLIDMALHDVAAKAAGLPLYKYLGGNFGEKLPLYHSITCIAPEEMARIAREEKAKGMTQFQVKLGADKNNEADIARLRLVREAVGAGPLVYGDWNCGATSLDAIRVGRGAAQADVMLEQPCQTIAECAKVRHATGLPMKLDENAHDIASLIEGHQSGCMDAAALKISKFGGVSEMRKARDLCQTLGIKMCIEDTWGSDITTSAALHIGASTHPKFIMNVCDLSSYVAPKLDETLPVRQDGHILPPEGLGLGVRPNEEALGAPIAVLS